MNLTFATVFLAAVLAGGSPYLVLAAVQYSECGGVVPICAWSPTTISYTQGERFCVWTLLAEDNVTPVRMEIWQNITSLDDGIVAYFWNSTGLTGYQLPHSNTNMTFEFPPLFLTFSSHTPNANNGLKVTFPGFAGPPSRFQHEAYHLEKDEGTFIYPQIQSGRVEYGNNERASIVVHPLPRETDKSKKVTLTMLGTELDYDFVHVYTFMSYRNYDPIFRGRFSGVGTFHFWTETFDPLVFLFTSDQRVTGKGFTIDFKNLQSKEL
jgi:hypothetical protein